MNISKRKTSKRKVFKIYKWFPAQHEYKLNEIKLKQNTRNKSKNIQRNL